MVDPILDADGLIEVAQSGGSVVDCIEGRSLFKDERERNEALASSEALAKFLGEIDNIAIPKEMPPEPSIDIATDLQDAATDVGKAVPRLVLAMRATRNMCERKALMTVLDYFLEAHRQLSAWSSNASEYRTEKAVHALRELQGIVRLAKDLSAHMSLPVVNK